MVFKHPSGVAPDTPDQKLGISVFTNACLGVALDGDGICTHIDKFYRGTFPQPCAFWKFDTAILAPPEPNPANIPEPVVLNVPSETGDECHHNIHHLTDSRARKIFETKIAEGRLGLCDQNKCEEFTAARAVELREQILARL